MGANTHKRHRLFACVILNGTAGELQVELVICVKPQINPVPYYADRCIYIIQLKQQHKGTFSVLRFQGLN